MPTDETASPDRLLLVDDNPTNLQVLFQALEEEGYELLVAQTGEEALATAKEAQPQLILLDINMPGIDGYETCRRLKAERDTRDAAVIFLSARGDVEDKVKGLGVGAVDYIGKPFQFEEVVARVRKHLDTFHQHRRLRQKTKELEIRLDGGFQQLSDDEICRLLAMGESDRVEFKSTLRHNLHTKQPDKRIENACLKTVAAYLNGSGGVLFVGVDDEGSTLGLDQDGFASDDKLLLHWNGLIKNFLGVEFTSQIRSEVRVLDGIKMLVVQCQSSTQPVFLRRDNDEVFFVRTGNGTQPLKPSEILAFLQQRAANQKPSIPIESPQGRQLGQYILDEQIGSGSMGVVFRGQHKLLRRPVAMKLLTSANATEEMIGRFEREVQRTAQLNHPNTVAIYDYGHTAEGGFYYVMEYLSGITLEELVQQYGPQPGLRVVAILKQICGCLSEAHEEGLIHRDIKPANLMLNHRGGIYDFVKLLDFGLVKSIDAADEVALTQPGIIAGTPLYLSPEAIHRPQEIDARSDLYSLGALGYYLLAGRPVFEGPSLVDICVKHANTQPDPPSKSRGEPIAPELERLILKCLEKDPAHRPQTARELLKKLSACETMGSWTQELAEHWWNNTFKGSSTILQ